MLSHIRSILENCGPNGSGWNGFALHGAAVGTRGWFGFYQLKHLPVCAGGCVCVSCVFLGCHYSFPSFLRSLLVGEV